MRERTCAALVSFGDAAALTTVSSLSLVFAASLLARTGIPFSAAYTAGIFTCAIGTLAISWQGRTRLALPSPAIAAWVVYQEIIARGISWQEMLGISAITSLAAVLLIRTHCCAYLTAWLPPIIRTGLILGLSLSMLTSACGLARILLPSPWALTMGGTLSDPLTYYTCIGIILVLLLHVMHMRGALVLGMTAVGVLTWMAGFWEVPAAPFFQPEGLDTVIGALAFPSAEQLFPAAVLIFALLCALLLESGAVLALQEKGGADDKGSSSILMRLFSMSFLSALLGALPLTIAPISAALPATSKEQRLWGIPCTAGITALLLLALLPCVPLMQAIADFPVMPAVAVGALGLMLLIRALHAIQEWTAPMDTREACVIGAFFLAAHDIKAGLCAALLLWTVLTAAGSSWRDVPRSTWVLTILVLGFFLSNYL